MTEQELRDKMQTGFAEVKPMVEQMTNLIMQAFEKGFTLGLSIMTQAATQNTEYTMSIDLFTSEERAEALSRWHQGTYVDAIKYLKSCRPQLGLREIKEYVDIYIVPYNEN